MLLRYCHYTVLYVLQSTNIVKDGEENYDLDVNYDEYVGRK